MGGEDRTGASALCTYLGPVGSPVLASISVSATIQPCAGTRCLEKPNPALVSVSSGLMMCICRLETGSQSINVCANFLFPPQPPSPYDLIYVGCVLSNDGMTTLFHVLKVLLSCRAPELMVALGLELCLTGLLPRKPVWWQSW